MTASGSCAAAASRTETASPSGRSPRRCATRRRSRNATPTEEALEKLAALTSDAEVTERVASAIGLSAASFPVEELVWGARRLLEIASDGERPVLVLFDDIHWAEPTFLELIEQVVEHASDSQLVVICTARHEFVERNPDFSTEGGAVRILLERLSEADAAAVAEHLLGMAELDAGHPRPDRRSCRRQSRCSSSSCSPCSSTTAPIVFEDGAWRAAATIDDVAVPPTIHALLAARLDALGSEERAVIEPASVIGQLFVHDAVHHLAPEYVRPELGSHLVKLTDKQLILRDQHATRTRTHSASTTSSSATLRTTASSSARGPTSTSAFVEWADSVNREGATEYEEILGYHLEQAHRYLSELGPLDDRGREIGARRLHGASRPQGAARSRAGTCPLRSISSVAPPTCFRGRRPSGSS